MGGLDTKMRLEVGLVLSEISGDFVIVKGDNEVSP